MFLERKTNPAMSRHWPKEEQQFLSGYEGSDVSDANIFLS